MSEEQLFEQMKMWRNWTVEFLRTIPEEVVDQIPSGHNNSIRWNAGHILVGWDNTMFPAVDKERQMPNRDYALPENFPINSPIVLERAVVLFACISGPCRQLNEMIEQLFN